MKVFAHTSGAPHDEPVAQQLISGWLAVPLFLLVLAGLVYGLYRLKISLAKSVLILMVALIATGVGLLQVIPAMGATAIVLGLVLSLLITLAALAAK